MFYPKSATNNNGGKSIINIVNLLNEKGPYMVCPMPTTMRWTNIFQSSIFNKGKIQENLQESFCKVADPARNSPGGNVKIS